MDFFELLVDPDFRLGVFQFRVVGTLISIVIALEWLVLFIIFLSQEPRRKVSEDGQRFGKMNLTQRVSRCNHLLCYLAFLEVQILWILDLGHIDLLLLLRKLLFLCFCKV